MMTPQKAIELFDHALTDALKGSDAIPKAIEQIRQGGWSVQDVETILHLQMLKPQVDQQSDADFLRDMRIDPNIIPVQRKRFARWPRKKYSLALLLVSILGVSMLTGCANIHIDLGCQSTAPTITNAPSHVIQKHPVCGLKR